MTTGDLLLLGEELTRALDSGDVEEWLALTDLDAQATQQQRDWFAGVQAVPMEVREMHPTFLVRSDDGTGRATAHFAFRYQVTGADPVPVLEEYEFTLTPAESGWRVSAIDGAGGVYATYPQLWDLGPISVAESAQTVVLYAGESPSAAELRALDDAVGAVLDALPLEGDPRLVVEYADPAAMAQMLSMDQADWHSEGYGVLASAEVDDARALPDVEDGEMGTPRLIVNREEHAAETGFYPGARGGSPLTRYALTYLVMTLRHQDTPGLEWVDAGLAWSFESAGDPVAREDALLDYAAGLGDVSQVSGFPPDHYLMFYSEAAASTVYQY